MFRQTGSERERELRPLSEAQMFRNVHSSIDEVEEVEINE